jgi:hypothetical protein
MTALVVALVAACSSSSKSTTSNASPTTAAGTPPSAAAGAPGAFAKAHYTTTLSGVCPNPFVVQADWLPEAEHGFLYQMIGGGGTSSQYVYQGPLGSTGINLEILSGGPGLGNGVNQPSSVYVGNLVKNVTPDATFESTDDAIQYSKQYPTTQVFAQFQKSPQIIIFDPGKYHITSLADLKTAATGGAKIYVTSATFSYVRWLIGQGIPSSAFIGGYAGDLEKFVGGGGSLLNQGYSTNEIFTLEHLTSAWDKPVGYVYVADLGFPFYQSSVTVATNKLASLTPCLQKLVPIMQHALVDYVHNPGEVNTLLAEFNNKGLGAAFWHTPVNLNNAATQVMLSDRLVANTPGTSSVGGFDMAAVNRLIHELVPLDQAEGLTSLNPQVQASDIATNKFVDTSIGL